MAWILEIPFIAAILPFVRESLRILIWFPVLIFLIRWIRTLRRPVDTPPPLAMLINRATRDPIFLTHREMLLGRSGGSDIVLNFPSVSRNHAVLTYRNGQFVIADNHSKTGVEVNGHLIHEPTPLEHGDRISLGGVVFSFSERVSGKETPSESSKKQKRVKKPLSSTALLRAVTWIQALGFLRLLLCEISWKQPLFLICFPLYIAMEWIYTAILRKLGRKEITLESAAFFLTGLGLWALGGVRPAEVPGQMAACLIGLGAFHAVRLFMSRVERVMKWKVWIGLLAVALFAVNLTLGTVLSGSRNWILLGPISIQPSEFIKMAFIVTGATTLDRLQNSRHITWFLVFFAICMGSLAWMGDFGTACVFFATFLLMSFLRSGRILTTLLMLGGAAGGVAAVLISKPYVARRFAAWRHVWEHASDGGYQQTRLMIAVASGGLLGLGPGQGYLKNIAAATTDLIFGVVCEEWGLLLALVAIGVYMGLLVLAVKASATAGSSMFVIAGVGAAGLILFQAGLNIFGVTDILPLTGITLPFLSRGGSSLVSCWGLLGFLAALEDSGRFEPKKKEKFTVTIPGLEEEPTPKRKKEGSR